ncbi:hypothetical protein CN918_32490 [Priestia megaterium]|nr:hypothetical protein CN918_32490 [Priestia megaterium]
MNVTTLHFKDNFLEVKSDGIHVTGDEKAVLINTLSTPSSSAFRTNSGDSLWISNEQLYIHTVLTDVIINGKFHYRSFLKHVSESFREFCEEALRKNVLAIRHSKSNQGETSDVVYTIATFKHDSVHFEINVPLSNKDPYVFYFYLNRELQQAETDEFKKNSIRNNFKDFSIRNNGLGAMMQTNSFDVNDLLHVLSFVNHLTDRDNKDNSISYTA